jgi:hypothetical protein
MSYQMVTKRSLLCAATVVTASLAAACGGNVIGAPGSVQVALTSADTFTPDHVQCDSAHHVTKVIVTIEEIDARIAGAGWTKISNGAVTVDLLALDAQALTTLGVSTLPQGHVRELRLVLNQIGDYVVRSDGSMKPLEVPDNGIVKVKGDLDLDDCLSGLVILDFDPRLHIEQENGHAEYELGSTARIKTEEVHNACQGGGGGNPGGMPCNVVCDPNTQVCQNGMCVPKPVDPCDPSVIVCVGGTTCHVVNGMGQCF